LLARDEPLAFVVRKMTTHWIAPARIDDELEVVTEFVEVKGARMVLVQTMRRGETIVASADVDAACMNLAGRPRRIPPDLAALIA
ncbi:MAG: acyl-CoA thioesterase, partial [Parvularculaceae bacterium]|nr:acyl-CoA thioesterase [Parvularculaceae bacterium]